MQKKSIWLSKWWVWEKAVFIANISDKTWFPLQDIIILCLMTLCLRTCSKSAKASYPQHLLQFPVTSKGLRCKVSSLPICCASNTSKCLVDMCQILCQNSLLPTPGYFALFLPSFLVQEGGINPEEMSYLQTNSC